MAAIRLPCGLIALVDEEDFDRVAQIKWHAKPSKKRLVYAVHRIRAPGGVQRQLLMHRFILGVPPEILVDHRDGNGLNNRRLNLRECTNAQNAANRKRLGQCLKGVWRTESGKYSARISHLGQRTFLGTFDSEIAAAFAYDAAAQRLFGEFAKLNFPDNHFGEVDAAA
jgi:hypothetical protein